jgi:hypothetical protein
MRVLVFLLLLLLLPLRVVAAPLTAADTQKLHDELTTDPLQLGYNVDPTFYVDNNGDASLAPMLNIVGAGVAFEVANVISSAKLWEVIVSDELSALATPQRTLLQIALQVSSYDLGLPEVLKKLGDIFPAGSVTRSNLQALQKRQGTRGEVLLGKRGIVITIANVACALRGVGCAQ